MANEKILNTRIQLKYDSYENWVTNNPVLKAGEAAVATLQENKDGVQSAPTVLIKIGDGVNAYKDLKFISGVAADVYSWAKAENKPVYEASEITGLAEFIGDEIQDTDTQYRLVMGEKEVQTLITDPETGEPVLGEDGLPTYNVTTEPDPYTYKLQAKGLTDADWTDVEDSVIVIPQYDDTEVKERLDAVESIVGTTAVVDYKVEVTESTESTDYAKVYTITQAASGLNATINIPKDMVIASGEVITYTDETLPTDEDDAPTVAGTYLVLTLSNANGDRIWINVEDLIEYVTSGSVEGDQIMVDVSNDYKVTATLSDGSVTLAQLHADTVAAFDPAGAAAAVSEALTGTAEDGTDALTLHGLTNRVAAAEESIANIGDNLADIASTGSVNDLLQADGDVIIFNCGTSNIVDAGLTIQPNQTEKQANEANSGSEEPIPEPTV